MPITHKVNQGECGEGIAWAHGLEDFKAVWNSGDNAELRKRRSDPNILMPGDALVVPEAKPRVYMLATGKHHRIVLKIPQKELRLRVLAHKDEPLANAKYRLILDDVRQPREGTTDGDGVLKEKVRVHIRGGLLQIDGRRFRLRFNYINPFPAEPDESMSGVSSRLTNLGYESGGASKAGNPALSSALALYQSDAEIDPTGEADSATKDQLEKDYGC
jgi:N-acetylmuramoyl-L-alanine amidase